MSNKNGFDLEGRVAIVTGAAQGLGEAMAEALAGAGASIIIADVNIAEAKKAAEKLMSSGAKVMAKKVDVSKGSDIDRLVEGTLSEFQSIDILVNNAGINQGGEFPPESLDERIWDKVMEVNLRSVFLCCKRVGKVMIKQRKGKIINLASIAGLAVTHLTDRHPLAYCVSKAGVIMLTKVLASEWAKYNINVNAIAPTYFKTAMINPDARIQTEMIRDIPMGRLGEPKELGGTVIYLASVASDFVTGHTLLVDGGYTVW